MAHPKGFEPLASAFGGLSSAVSPTHLPDASGFVHANEAGIDVDSTDITRTGEAFGKSADTYRGWSISWDYGRFRATGPNYDASYEGPEDGWVATGGDLDARTREDLIEDIDAWIEEHPEDQVPGFAGGAL